MICVSFKYDPYWIPAQLLSIQRQSMNKTDRSRIFTMILKSNTCLSSLQHEPNKVKYLKISDNGDTQWKWAKYDRYDA